jgi:hypothetical protein
MSTRRSTYIIFIQVIVFLIGCTPKLGKEFYSSPEEILIQQFCSLLPNGWNAGIMSSNYPGILAIINDDIVFDALGPGSRPWMERLDPFKIPFQAIHNINLSEEVKYYPFLGPFLVIS